ncbi:glycosyl hydrolase [Pseudoflavitalea sp. G-6-1-2]|uniref:TIM-barrel domain-containing protein n=1 Tax=Pseudoflavitalea sp. G-6-1-2 TaxID=2728841 RepID=UPI00146EE1EC|nr:TIM-barrel domain-containing protein [Pseudoflavitalea sp. G-6-1-2]NML19363.1 glycosyl hydrolase [Pseudoflavitalea sp. G-6-1-2]
MRIRKILISGILAVVFSPLAAQQVVVNTVGKDPFNGKVTDVLYKAKEGQWNFYPYGNQVIRAVYKPADYNRNELMSNAVITSPQPSQTKVTNGPSQAIDFENGLSIVIQRENIYFKQGREIKVKSVRYFSENDNRGFRFQLSDGEKWMGGGERAIPMDRRGYRLLFYNTPVYGYGLGAENLNFSVPVLLSSNGYALFFDNPSKGYADIGLTDKSTLEAGFSSGELNFYVVFGKNLDEMLLNYSALTGRQPLPPRWAMGNFVSRFGYRNETQVKDVVSKMQAAKYPVDGLIFDLFWFGDHVKGTMGNFDWVSSSSWPNPKLMLTQFRQQNIKPILIAEPFFLKGTTNYAEAAPFLATNATGQPYTYNNFFFGEGGLIDIFRKPAKDFMWKLYKKQVSNGVSGWWSDLGEPEKHPNEIIHNLKDQGIARPVKADEVHNIYGHQWSAMLAEKYSNEYSDQRLFHLNRAGFAGSQRYSVFPWTGDVARSWSGLKAQWPILMGMSLSGLPYIHSDAGGFAVADEADFELYTRWLQFAAFTPVFRPHGTAPEAADPTLKSIPSEPVFWDEKTQSIVKKYIRLRYELLPYNYSLSFDQAVMGKPLMRPLYYYGFNDAEAFNATDQYMWGDQLLVAPVMTQSATSRKVYLPEGQWYRFSDNKLLDGKQWIDQPADLSYLPLYAKAGSFVPLWQTDSVIRSTGQYDSKNISVVYYPSANPSSYTWYDDDGAEPRALERANYELVTFTGTTRGSMIVIDIKTNNVAAYKRKYQRTFTLLIPGNSVKEVKANGTAVKVVAAKPVMLADGPFTAATIIFDGKPTSIEVRL